MSVVKNKRENLVYLIEITITKPLSILPHKTVVYKMGILCKIQEVRYFGSQRSNFSTFKTSKNHIIKCIIEKGVLHNTRIYGSSKCME